MLDFANQRFWQFAILTAAGTIAVSSPADAAAYYWNGYDNVYYAQPEPMPRPHRQKVRRNPAKKDALVEKEAGSKPQGPLVIAISIDQQRVRVYDSKGLYAESPVSTGMKGHSTPMGIFSVIQKQKFHRSNIYSGAPMPFMQRITWSGVAMHAGVLPGYPASHGCIRMPNAFAIKMYNWTRMGARVIITPGELSPESFSHPLLATQKVVPVADEVLKMDAPLGVKSDKGVEKPETRLDLRTSIDHPVPASLRDNTHTADASNARASATMSDASSAATDKPISNADDRTVGESSITATTNAAKPEVSANDHVQAEAKADAPKADAAKPAVAEAPKVDAPKTDAVKADAKADAAKPADQPAAAAADAADAKKDTARLPGLARADTSKRAGQIAVFISRKDSKLYVRQNFAPLFEVPVTIAPGDRPLGTHVFTAEADKTDANALRWSVVTLPTRHAARLDEEEHSSRRRKVAAAAAIEAKPQPAPDSPAAALDRITIPADAMARIAEALGTGGSIIVSDLGVNSGETGEGTDFIVPLR